MLERGRLRAAIAFAPRVSTSPYVLGWSGAVAKSSISLLSRTPVRSAVIREPYGVLIVIVSATALPSESVADRCVVPASRAGSPGPSTRIGRSPSSQRHGARCHQAVGARRARSCAAYGFATRREAGTETKSGSPTNASVSANDSFIASAIRCTLADEPAPSGARSAPSRTLSVSTSAMPPEDGGGNV